MSHESQAGLFDVPRARNHVTRDGRLVRDPQTSFDAARAQTNEKFTVTQRAILNTVKLAGARGLTDEELLDALHRTFPARHDSPSSVRSRRAELTRRGLVVDSGKRRPTQYGQSAVVWRSV
jgi:hypothetical protein